MKTRYRLKRRMFRPPLVVLQIEESFQRCAHGALGVECWTVTQWRDATPEDVMNGETAC